MPTYDYKCQTCNHRFEAFQGMLDVPLSDCPECDGLVVRVIGKNVAISFKGSGFYITDSVKTPSSEAKTAA